jgi:hypothetical protein
MRTTYDPLWRSTIGFDRLFDLVDAAQPSGAEENYHPATSSGSATTVTRFRSRWRAFRRMRSASRPNRAY